MCGGGTTSTQTVSIPPEVLKNYEEVFARAKQVAQKPFQEYSRDPNAFVAGFTPTQQAALENINALQGMATPDVKEGQDLIRGGIQQGTGLQYRSLGTVQRGQDIGEDLYGRSLGTAERGQGIGEQLYGRSLGTSDIGQAEASNIVRQSLADMAAARGLGQAYAGDAARNIYAGMAAADPYMRESTMLSRAGLGAGQQYAGLAGGYLGRGTADIGPRELAIEPYMSPYMQNVVRAQQALQAEENAAQRSALRGEAIKAGAFGGDRAGIAQANLARQQSLANQANLANLLQSGYGQALSAAQQQQAQALAAEQANRAAQQFGVQQAMGLGQQQFAQQLAAAQQLQGLGQALYGQNIGQGQAIQGLGQQQYGQGLGAAQAQAQFGQNLYQMAAQNAQLQQAAAQGMFGQAAQVAALQQSAGQGIFGMSAQNAQLQQAAGNNLFNYGLQGGQGIANLGLANQQAQMQAAQAQMAAGQAQQQTDQAAKTAMYNQFTQQQGFPYQQAQFLGNLAMGTGALSGSTTTTQSSGGGFFSDRRLKENVEDVGKTYDGQKIYRYNYKGDPRTQIGLMADESKDSAVGEYGGYKTVNYKKATDDAAKRGHFYAGGLVPSSMGGAVDQMNAYEGYARGGYAEGGDIASFYQSKLGRPGSSDEYAYWQGQVDSGEMTLADVENAIANSEEGQKYASSTSGKIDPRIAGFYDKYMFRAPDAEGAKYWQNALDKGTPIEEIERGISESRERQLVNQAPLTYDASKFATYEAPIRNRYGAAAAPLSSFRSSFDPVAVQEQQQRQQQQQTGMQQATGKGVQSQSPYGYGGYNQPSYGYGGYNQPSYGFGGYSQPSFGYGGLGGFGGYSAPSYGYGGFGGYSAPAYGTGGMGGMGGMGGYGGFGGFQNPMSNIMSGYAAGYGGPGAGMTGFMSGYNQGYGSQMGGYGAMGQMPQASGKGASSGSSGGGSAGAFRKGGRVGYAYGSIVDPNDLSALAANRLMELAPHAAGIPGQTLPGSQTYVPAKQLNVPSKILKSDFRPEKPVSGYEHAMRMAQGASTLNSMLDKKGLLGEEGFIRRNLPDLKKTDTAAGAGAPAPAPAPAAKPAANVQKDAALDGEVLPPELDPSLFGTQFSARGGKIYARNFGGSLPYSNALGGNSYIPQEVLEEPQIRKLPTNDAELRAAAKAATSQSGGLGQGIQAINAVDKLGKLGAKGIDKLGTLFGPGGAEAAATGMGTAATEAATAGLGAGAAAAGAGEAAAASLIPEAVGKGVAAGAEALPFLAALIPSDRKLKENIEPIGRLYDGQKVYRYNYKGDDQTHIGLMAQEVEKKEKREGHYNGGLVPRRGYATEGEVEADLPVEGGLAVAREAMPRDLERAMATEIIRRVAEEKNVPFNVAYTIADRESALNPNARAKTSGAAGLFQTIPSTFAAMGGRGDITDPEQNARAGIEYIAQNMKALKAQGRDATPGEIYLSHFLGTSGAKNVLANPDRPISETLSNYRAAVKANPFISNWTGNDALGWADARIAGQRFNAPPRPARDVPEGGLMPRNASTSVATIPNNIMAMASRSDAENAPEAQAARVAAGQEVVKPTGVKPTFVAPKSPRGEEQSWSDFLTSRQFIIPALTAIGTMGTTPTRNLGTALSAGLLAGTQSYADLEKKLSEVEGEREKTGTQAAETERKKMETRVLGSGLYERKFVPGVGLYVIDKSNPTKPPIQVSDKNMKPLPGYEGVVEKILFEGNVQGSPKTEGQPTAQGQPQTTKPSEPEKAPAPGAPKVEAEPAKKLDVNTWSPMVTVPEGYIPPEHMNIEWDEATKRKQAEIDAPIIKEQKRKAEASYDQLYTLEEMSKQFANIAKEGFLVSGPYAEERLNFAKKINSLVGAIGGSNAKPVFDTNNVAAMEALVKNTFNLGAALSRSIGTREPGIIVTQAVQANPGITNTEMGYKRVEAGLREAAKYEQDKAEFYDNYYSRFGHLSGAEAMFRKANPPQMYADRAILSTVDPRDREALVNAVTNNPDILNSAREKIDAKYGKGITDKILGR